mmetsp:Transcript_4164/g.6435  ORF Transcript_4164/g.6435 Transcript_4164/m.6435 type:complete len:323 (-) Transcript_4164:2946-3914(-)
MTFLRDADPLVRDGSEERLPDEPPFLIRAFGSTRLCFEFCSRARIVCDFIRLSAAREEATALLSREKMSSSPSLLSTSTPISTELRFFLYKKDLLDILKPAELTESLYGVDLASSAAQRLDCCRTSMFLLATRDTPRERIRALGEGDSPPLSTPPQSISRRREERECSLGVATVALSREDTFMIRGEGREGAEAAANGASSTAGEVWTDVTPAASGWSRDLADADSSEDRELTEADPGEGRVKRDRARDFAFPPTTFLAFGRDRVCVGVDESTLAPRVPMSTCSPLFTLRLSLGLLVPIAPGLLSIGIGPLLLDDCLVTLGS